MDEKYICIVFRMLGYLATRNALTLNTLLTMINMVMVLGSSSNPSFIVVESSSTSQATER